MAVGVGVRLGIGLLFGAHDQILSFFFSFDNYFVVLPSAPSLTRGRVCSLQLLLDLASSVILGFKSSATHDDILLPQIRDFPKLVELS
jgi:hypothetical protein